LKNKPYIDSDLYLYCLHQHLQLSGLRLVAVEGEI